MTLRQRKHPLSELEKARQNVVTLQKRSGGVPPPPPGLEPPEAELWVSLMEAFVLDDPASLSILQAGLEQRGRARRLRAVIDQAGETVACERWGVRPHPLLPHERASHAMFLSALRQLRIDV